MSAAVGYLAAGLALGVGAVLVKPKRSIGTFQAQVTLSEQHQDDLQITDHPIEKGAIISDHAYKLPARVTIKCAWSNSPSRAGLIDGAVGAVTGTIQGVTSILSGNSQSQVRDIYEKLLKLQAEAVPFDIFTGKRKYTDMLIQSLSVETDKNSENMLMVTAVCRQVIIVSTAVAVIGSDATKQADAKSTAPPANSGTRNLQPGTAFSNAGPGRGFIQGPSL